MMDSPAPRAGAQDKAEDTRMQQNHHLHLKKLGVLTALVAILALWCATALAALSYPFMTTTSDKVNMRRSASATSVVLERLDKGAAITVTGASGNYYKVTYNNRTGYIMKQYVVTDADSIVTPTPVPVETVGGYPYDTVTTAKVNLRAKRSTSSDILKKIPEGATVTVKGVTGTFASVDYNGTSGYVKVDYLVLKQVVKANERFIPPYGTGASLFIRPVLFGSGPQVGVKPADEYLLIIFVTPVGPYYKEGFNPIRVIIDRDHDRAAPLGTGHIKAGGNYGASLISSEEAHDKGYPSVLYLDAKEKKHIDECGAANFFGIRDGRYITPKSHSVLPSITNMSLMTLAADLGLKVESRPVEAEELSTFSEAGACGTAAVISPIGSIYDPETNHTYTYNNSEPGEWSKKLYHKLRAIQYGEEPDTHGWNLVLE